MGERAEFLGAFLRAPLATGAIAPSSPALARRMVEGLDLRSASTVVEVGPGTGAFTGAILEASGERTSVVAVEQNGAFAARLRERHPRLHVLHASVEHLPRLLGALGRGSADVVLCGLPWAIFDATTQRRLLRGISDSLRDGGHFVTFGYVHCAVLPGNRQFRRLVAADFVEIPRSPVVWNNLPPAIVYRWRRETREKRERDR